MVGGSPGGPEMTASKRPRILKSARGAQIRIILFKKKIQEMTTGGRNYSLNIEAETLVMTTTKMPTRPILQLRPTERRSSDQYPV